MSGIWWVMSFAEPPPPDGRGRLGGVITEADTLAVALTWTHLAGINPGGGIQAVSLRAPSVDPGMVDRLVTDRDEWLGVEIPGATLTGIGQCAGERSGA